ncbi:TetR/AcrR family transcriptional regulator [Fodinicola feengrottensis]
MPEPNRTTKRRAETRRRLVSVAYEVFAEHGIGDAPVELICERAGFTRGAFYSNFTSKEALFLAVYEEQMQVRLDRLRAAVDEVIADPASRHPESLRETLGRIGERFMAPLMSDKTWYLVCAEFRVQALRQPPLRAQTEAAQEKFRQATAEVLTESLRRLGMTLTVSARDAVLVMTATYETALERAIFEEMDSPLDNRFVTEVLPIQMMGLITPL